jgi:uncharacterized protein (TIGR02996 family)
MTEQTFVKAIVAEPDNAGIRLMFADWLEEEGRVELSELMRQSVNWRAVKNHGPTPIFSFIDDETSTYHIFLIESDGTFRQLK